MPTTVVEIAPVLGVLPRETRLKDGESTETTKDIVPSRKRFDVAAVDRAGPVGPLGSLTEIAESDRQSEASVPVSPSLQRDALPPSA